ncbi:helicase associated domain-containing protein, partial [Streptomyces sp. IBSBF 3136]|uniref:helicase associated domain-containing protein n=1 Tax=Streptomyces sp. IBSBF 3136 TaxID=2903524 RepID=UPI002FDC058D
PHTEALHHARTWAGEHGHLCPPIKTVHHDFPLGQWLNSQRHLAKKRPSPSPTQQTLATIDPWWNPPWPIGWQRTYHRARANPHHPTTRPWLQHQQRNWPLLHPDQQHLLTTTSLTTTRTPWKAPTPFNQPPAGRTCGADLHEQAPDGAAIRAEHASQH